MTNKVEFKEFNLRPSLLSSIEKCGFTAASAIQELTIGPILDGKDIFALAETGSGKTASFAIPVIEHILHDELLDVEDVHYVVLSPTRELAQQTHKVFKELGEESGINSVCVIGGENIDKQKKSLDKGAHVVIATPGRLVDLVKQEAVYIDRCFGIVFDEADRLFDMGFKKDIEYILGKMPDDRQLIMVSATTNQDVLNTAYKFNSVPTELRVSEDSLLVDQIDHKLAMVSSNEKMGLLVKTIRDHGDAYALVFCNTKFQTHIVAEWLMSMDFKAKAISGGLSQNKRTRLIKDFRSKKITILVCTDVAARGLDIKDVNLVINYDLPQSAENYVHRIGRTGRAGADGEAISFCAHEDCEFLDPIHELIGDKIPQIEVSPESFAKDLTKKPFIDRKTFKVVDRNTGRPLSDEQKEKRKKTQQKKIQKKEMIQNKKEKEVEVDIKNKRNIKNKTPAARINRVEPKVFTVQAKTQKDAVVKALSYFKVKYESQLTLQASKEGRKRFFLFGKRLTEYKYSVRPTYKKIIMPFLIRLLKLSDLKIYAKFSFDGKNIKVFFSGNDEKLLTQNDNELLRSLEHVVRVHLYSKIIVPNDLRISFRSKGSKNQEAGLIKMIEKVAVKVIDTGKPFTLRPLNSSDRRLVHKYLDNKKGVETVSIGDGRMKKIEIRPV